MPLYRYRCSNCNIEFEKLMSINEKCDDRIQILCPSCGCDDNEALMTRTNFALKGSGWYKDGYQKGGNDEAN